MLVQLVHVRLRYSLRRDRKIAMAYDAVCTKNMYAYFWKLIVPILFNGSKKIMSLIPAAFPNVNQFKDPSSLL